MAVNPDEMDALVAEQVTTQEPDDDDDTDTVDENVVDDLRKASDLLKQNRVLFEFLAEPNYCKSLLKRDRDAMLRQADKIDNLVDELEDTIEELEID